MSASTIERLTKLLPELEYSRGTHALWSSASDASLARNPDIGSRDFHRQCIADYDERISAIKESIVELRQLQASRDAYKHDAEALLAILNSAGVSRGYQPRDDGGKNAPDNPPGPE